MNYNEKIAILSGQFTALASAINGDESLKKGEKFLLLQRLFADIASAEKQFKKSEKEIKDWAIANLPDTGTGISNEKQYEGASVLIKYAYPKPLLDADKLAVELERAYNEIGTEFNISVFQKEATPRKTVIIQSILNK